MAFSMRVRDDAIGTVLSATPLGCKRSAEYIISPSGKGFRVYEAVSEYSSTTGGHTQKGKVQRDTDNKPFQFKTEAEAEEWLKAGLPVW